MEEKMQKITLAGNVGRDPETRYTGSGVKIVSFSVACNKKKAGKDETTWFRISVFGDRFDKMLPYIKKGSSLFVTGDLSVNEWTDANGEKRSSLEVNADSLNFSPFGRGDQNQQQASQNPAQNQGSSQEFQPAMASAPMEGQGGSDGFDEDEALPF